MSRVYAFLKVRPLGILGLILGLAIVMLTLRTEDTRDKVIRIETDSPCSFLSDRQCAIKLLASLKDKDIRKFLSKEVREVVKREVKGINRIQRERILREERRQSTSPTPSRVRPRMPNNLPTGDQRGRVPESTPQQPSDPSEPSDEEPSRDDPKVKLPVDLPPVGPIDPPSELPLPDMIPCVKTPITNC